MTNVKNLRAVFALPATQLQSILERDSARANVAVEVTLSAAGQGNETYAVGPAQAVMFLIGAVAAEGEAALVKVEPAGA